MRSFQVNKTSSEAFNSDYESAVINTDQADQLTIQVDITGSNLDCELSLWEGNNENTFLQNEDSIYSVTKADTILYKLRPVSRFVKIKLKQYVGSGIINISVNKK